MAEPANLERENGRLAVVLKQMHRLKEAAEREKMEMEERLIASEERGAQQQAEIDRLRKRITLLEGGEVQPYAVAHNGAFDDPAPDNVECTKCSKIHPGRVQWCTLWDSVDNNDLDAVRAYLSREDEAALREIRPPYPNSLEKRNPLQQAAAKGYTMIVSELLQARASTDMDESTTNGALHWACNNGLLPVVTLLLDHGVDVNQRGFNEATPLHYAASGGDVSIARLLLERGADPNLANTYRGRPINWASNSNHAAVVRLLLDHGVDVNQRGLTNMPPLHSAALSGAEEVARLLLDRGADLFAATEYGQRAIHYASERDRTVVVRLLLERGEDINVLDEIGRSPLHLAHCYGAENTANLLMERGAKLTALNYFIMFIWSLSAFYSFIITALRGG